ncbi:LOW QUALITY PROTEIN: NFX1-type zinc finger-containing protein 1 [Guaruba guarouba]
MRYQGGQSVRGPWNEQGNESRGRWYQGGQAKKESRRLRNGQENGREGRMQSENPHFHQNPVRGGAQLSEQSQQVRRIGYKFLENLKDLSEIVITLTSSLSLKELLSQMAMKLNFIQLICQVFRKVCSSQMDRRVQQLLGIVKESNFPKICLPQYVSDKITEAIPAVHHQYSWHISIISLLQDLISIFPGSSVQKISILLTVLPASVNALSAAFVDITEEMENHRIVRIGKDLKII